MECNICEAPLTDDELKVLHVSRNEKHPEYYILVCKKHWCECLPEETPWRWVHTCPKCNKRMICKSCYWQGKEDIRICSVCGEKERRKFKN